MRWLPRRSPPDGNGRHADAGLFLRARLRLTLWYVLLLTIVLAGFSVALYVALAAQLSNHTDPGDQEPRQQIEREASDFALGRLRLLLLAGNVVLLAGTAAGSYALAGKTLRPVAAALARQRRFAADASHELRTPLTIIRGTVEVALQRKRQAAEYRDAMEEVHSDVVALSALVEQLLYLARGTAAPAHAYSAADVATVMQAVAREVAALAHERRSTITFALAQGLRVRADPATLQQIVGNLVVNALRHTPAGTIVRIEARRDGDMVALRVCDNGPGIPPTERERIFQPFHRLASADAEGAGLGLALVHELVTVAGGSVAVAEAAGGGASFDLRLPAA